MKGILFSHQAIITHRAPFNPITPSLTRTFIPYSPSSTSHPRGRDVGKSCIEGPRQHQDMCRDSIHPTLFPFPDQNHKHTKKRRVTAHAAASAFFGVAAFLGVAFFAAAFLGAAFLVMAAFAGVLVTRPDLVLPSTLGSSMTAGA